MLESRRYMAKACAVLTHAISVLTLMASLNSVNITLSSPIRLSPVSYLYKTTL